MRLRGGVRLAPLAGGGVCTTSASAVEMNLLEFLRSAVAPDSAMGLDGGENFVDLPAVPRGEHLCRQLDAVSRALDEFVALASDAAGCRASVTLTLRQVEFNRDLPVADARRLAHGLKHAPNPWYRVSRARHYVPHADLELSGNDVTVTWPADARDLAARLKFYAKRPDRLRIEMCLDSSAAVAHRLSRGARRSVVGAAADGAGLAGMLRSLAAACEPFLDAMEAHVAAVSGPQAGVLGLLSSLAPLLRASAAPAAGRPGRRAGATTRRDAEDALFHLLELGRFDASALRTNGTVRKALRRLREEGALGADSLGRAALYTVPLGMTAARLALAGSLWPDRGIVAWGEDGEDIPGVESSPRPSPGG